MLPAQIKKLKSEFECRTFTRVLAVVALATASVLAFAMPGSVLAGSSRARSVNAGRAEKSNRRISVRPQVALASRTLTTSPAVPFFS